MAAKNPFLVTDAEIPICNTNAQWFVPFVGLSLVQRESIEELFERVKKERGEMHRTLKGSRSAGKYMLSLTEWRKEFHMDMINIGRIPGDYRGGPVDYSGQSELSLWFADKYGNGNPDFFGYGKQDDRYITVSGQCIVVPVDEGDAIIEMAESIEPEMRIQRPSDNSLYVGEAVITPQPFEPEMPRRGLVVNGILEYPADSDLVEIDVFEIYRQINMTYQHMRGPGAKAVSYENLPSLSRAHVELALGRAGYDRKDRRESVINILLDTHYLEGNDEEGYMVTSGGVAMWNMGVRHNW